MLVIRPKNILYSSINFLPKYFYNLILIYCLFRFYKKQNFAKQYIKHQTHEILTKSPAFKSQRDIKTSKNQSTVPFEYISV